MQNEKITFDHLQPQEAATNQIMYNKWVADRYGN
jgi:hypothetical protein